jgi:hypothetical protein
MKKFLTTVGLAAVAASALAQGTIKFANTSSILISYENQPGLYSTIPPNTVAPFYFAVLSAPLGVLDPSQFIFAGIYASNTTTAGRLQGGSLLGVAMNSTWAPAVTRQFLVAGWDGTPTFDPAWMAAPASGNGWHGLGVVGPTFGPVNYFGLSMISFGEAGGIPALVAFSGSTISSGFVLYWEGPEPTTAALAALGAAVVLIFRLKARLEGQG